MGTIYSGKSRSFCRTDQLALCDGIRHVDLEEQRETAEPKSRVIDVH